MSTYSQRTAVPILLLRTEVGVILETPLLYNLFFDKKKKKKRTPPPPPTGGAAYRRGEHTNTLFKICFITFPL